MWLYANVEIIENANNNDNKWQNPIENMQIVQRVKQTK